MTAILHDTGSRAKRCPNSWNALAAQRWVLDDATHWLKSRRFRLLDGSLYARQSFENFPQTMGLSELLHLLVYPRGRNPTEELQPQCIVYTLHVHFLVVGLHVRWDFLPVEMVDPFGHAFDILLCRLSSCCCSSELPHRFDKELCELPPFTSGSPNMSRCYARACRRAGPRGSRTKKR